MLRVDCKLLLTLSLQALTCFSDAVKSKLSDIRGLEATALAPQAEQIKGQLDTVASFCLKAVQEDPSMLEHAARDLAFSMAQIYTSECIGLYNVVFHTGAIIQENNHNQSCTLILINCRCLTNFPSCASEGCQQHCHCKKVI